MYFIGFVASSRGIFIFAYACLLYYKYLPIAIKYGIDWMMTLLFHSQTIPNLCHQDLVWEVVIHQEKVVLSQERRPRPELTRIVKFQPRALITPALSWLQS